MRKFSNINSKKQNKKQGGFVLEGMTLVMLIVAILVVAGIAWYLQSLRSSSVNNNTSELISISATAKKKYGIANQYSNVTTAIAVTGQVIPIWLRDGTATTATNSFGGAITVTPATLTGADDALNVAWPNVPKSQCSDIVNGLGASARRIQVAGVDVKATDAVMNIATVETQCDSADALLLNVYVGRN